MTASPYLIGIDLGTTNSALAYLDAAQTSAPMPKVFPVAQLLAPGEMGEQDLLPSFLYLPGQHDLPAGACAVPWDDKRHFIVGALARSQGAKVPNRLVASAKSWLCHAGVDRTAAILPWSAPPEVQRVSPVDASTRYLRHLAEAWNHQLARGRNHIRLEEQDIVLTVPASFDDVARHLTAEAAQQAGFKQLTLLEEPQAAFYAWLAEASRSSHHLQGLQAGMTCLVIDVGGGTTDFSLIDVVAEEGDVHFHRRAVGEHLLLGGDNMDLTLARHVETRLPEAGRLDAARFAALTQACRWAKETLLAEQPPEQCTVNVMGRGRSVIASSLHAALTPHEVRQILFDGFFPDVPFEASLEKTGRTGLHDMGLPFVSDPAITRQLAAFLRQHQIDPDRPPQAILFNGGVFQPLSVRQRLLDVMHHWFDRPKSRWQPIVLTTPSLDLAVAMGAAYYGWLRRTHGRRIRGGLARSYYLAVSTTPPSAADAEQSKRGPTASLLCVVPQHLEEGQRLTLREPVLELALGQPVQFPLYTSTLREQDQAGQMLTLSTKELLRLPPLQTVLKGGKRSGTKTVPVTLAVQLTDIGTLELQLVGQEKEQTWRLEFNTRVLLEDEEDEEADAAPPPGQEKWTTVWPEAKVQAALDCLRQVFAQGDEKAAEELTKTLEQRLDASRQSWPMSVCRRLAETLLDLAEQRSRTPTHWMRWHHLAGFGLRPGFGEVKDRFRVETLWKLLSSPVRQQAGAGFITTGRMDRTAGADVWILWRRVSGGLSTSHQLALMDRLRPILLAGSSTKASLVRPSNNELAEMWRAAASLERLEPSLKVRLGEALLQTLRKPPAPPHAFWSLTRLGSRVLLYGPMNTIVHPDVVAGWLERLLTFAPSNSNERQNWLFCLAHLARRTQQRALDVDDATRQHVVDQLRKSAAAQRLLHLVEEGGKLEATEQQQLFGEQLPLGLRLMG